MDDASVQTAPTRLMVAAPGKRQTGQKCRNTYVTGLSGMKPVSTASAVPGRPPCLAADLRDAPPSGSAADEEMAACTAAAGHLRGRYPR